MKWKKLGKIFCADNNSDLMITGGRTPVAQNVEGDLFKIYYAAYDIKMRGKIYALYININEPNTIQKLVLDPIIDKGDIGFFDDNGIIPSSIVIYNNSIFLYTCGFSVKNKIIFDSATGLAISKDNGKTFMKIHGPVMDRTIYDPCFATSPFVLHDDGIFKAWYVSCDRWEKKEDGGYKHFYNIKYKESKDGIHWNINSRVAIDYQNEYEYAISRPSVMKDGPDDYKMWYSFRAQPEIEKYRIGYAESTDGINWTRKDELMKHFDVSEKGWDSEMVCYPYVFDHKGRRYMLYNGNHYGKTGFGLAILEDE